MVCCGEELKIVWRFQSFLILRVLSSANCWSKSDLSSLNESNEMVVEIVTKGDYSKQCYEAAAQTSFIITGAMG